MMIILELLYMISLCSTCCNIRYDNSYGYDDDSYGYDYMIIVSIY